QECKSLPRWCLKNLPSHTTIPPLPTTADQWPRHYHHRGTAAQKFRRRHPSRRRRRRLHPPPVWPRNMVSTHIRQWTTYATPLSDFLTVPTGPPLALMPPLCLSSPSDGLSGWKTCRHTTNVPSAKCSRTRRPPVCPSFIFSTT